MTEFLTAIGLLLAIEGVLYAAFPKVVKSLTNRILKQPVDRMRILGVVCLAVGVLLIWAVRS